MEGKPEATGSEGARGVPGTDGAANVDASAATVAGGAAPAGQRPRKRWPLAVGAVAAVLIVAGAGFWVWHEQPSFCNAVCHQPMDAYVEGYFGDPELMAYAHQVQGATCLDCHEPKLEEQIAEAAVWVAGDYAMADDGKLATVGVRSDAAMCADAGCHDFGEVVAATANWGGEAGVNPHDSHQGYALDCSSCHTAHGQSYMYCNACHEFAVPQGWAEPASSAPSAR